MSVCECVTCLCNWCVQVRVQVDIPPLVLGLGFASLELQSVVWCVRVSGVSSDPEAYCACVQYVSPCVSHGPSWFESWFEGSNSSLGPSQGCLLYRLYRPYRPYCSCMDKPRSFLSFCGGTRPLVPRVCVPHLH